MALPGMEDSQKVPLHFLQERSSVPREIESNDLQDKCLLSEETQRGRWAKDYEI